MRFLLAVITIGFVLAAVPAASAAARPKPPRPSHSQQMKAKKNQAKARKAVKQHKANPGRRTN